MLFLHLSFALPRHFPVSRSAATSRRLPGRLLQLRVTSGSAAPGRVQGEACAAETGPGWRWEHRVSGGPTGPDIRVGVLDWQLSRLWIPVTTVALLGAGRQGRWGHDSELESLCNVPSPPSGSPGLSFWFSPWPPLSLGVSLYFCRLVS